jgi:hypothetical protein
VRGSRLLLGGVMIGLGFLITSQAPVLVVIETLLILVGAFIFGNEFWTYWWSPERRSR